MIHFGNPQDKSLPETRWEYTEQFQIDLGSTDAIVSWAFGFRKLAVTPQ
jgi:hypothetical protein